MKNPKLLLTLIITLSLLCAGTFAIILHQGTGNADDTDAVTAGRALGDSAEKVVRVASDATAKEKDDAKATEDPADRVIAHRGSSGESLEHTFQAYDEAISQGARYIEQDIVMSKDWVLYVSHDKDAQRITGDSRSYADMSSEEIDQLKSNNGENIHRLSDVFDRYKTSITYVIEIKGSDSDTVNTFSQLVDSYNMSDNIIVQSFHPDSLSILEEKYPDMPKLYLCDDQGDIDRGLDKNYVDIVSVKYTLLNEDNASRVHSAGKKFSAWTLDEEDTIKKAIELDTDIYFTDRLQRAFELEKKHRKSKASQTSEHTSILLSSDFQQVDGWPAPIDSFSSIAQSVINDGKNPNALVYCGDYTNDRKLHDYQLSPDDQINSIRGKASEIMPGLTDERMLFVQGNHDKLTGSITGSGLHGFDDHYVYVLNTENDFPWKQGKTSGCFDKVTRASHDMKSDLDALIEKGDNKPVLIAGHVPLHFTARTSSRHSTGDNLYSSLIFNVVNEAAKKLDIIYFYGHNHSKGWDCYMGGSSVYKPAGDKILIPAAEKSDRNTDRFTEETLNFTYLNAGYTGYYMNCGPEETEDGTADRYHAADETLTSTLCEIYPDRIVLTRYDAGGVHPLGWDGEADPYKDYIDRGLIDEKYYEKKTDSPQTIMR